MQQEPWMHDWDGWRFFLAMAQTGTLRGAADRLGINHATVARQLSDFEATLGVQLFERNKRGYKLTSAGLAALPHAEDMQARLRLVHEQVSGADTLLQGDVSLTLADSMVDSVASLLADFRVQYPSILVSLQISNHPENLQLREVDLALRTTQAPPPQLAGRRIGRQAAALYAHPDLAKTLQDKTQPRKTLQQMPWIGWAHTWRHLPDAQWQTQHIPPDNIVCRVDSPHAMLSALQAGLGVAHSVSWLAERAGLERIGPLQQNEWLDLWVLMHPDARRIARVGALANFLVDRLRPLCEP
jgi:DNA-binding transcriptional LysR family regulator